MKEKFTDQVSPTEARRKMIGYDENSKWLTALGFLAVLIVWSFGFICGYVTGLWVP